MRTTSRGIVYRNTVLGGRDGTLSGKSRRTERNYSHVVGRLIGFHGCELKVCHGVLVTASLLLLLKLAVDLVGAPVRSLWMEEVSPSSPFGVGHGARRVN